MFLVIAAAFGLMVVAFMKLLRLVRAVTWPKERVKRTRWISVVAAVESWTSIGDAGLFRVVLRVPVSTTQPTYRTGDAPRRLRAFVRLPQGAVDWLERGELPVRIPPNAPERLAVDLTTMVSDAAERDAFIEWGSPKWSSA